MKTCPICALEARDEAITCEHCGTVFEKVGLCQEHYESGQLKKEWTYKDGIKHCSWYYKNGQLETEGAYKNGIKHGPYKSYYPNGRLEAEWTFEDGEKHGPYMEYYENEQLKAEWNYKKGKKHGPYVEYLEDGQLKEERFYTDGEKKAQPKRHYSEVESYFKTRFPSVAFDSEKAQAVTNKAKNILVTARAGSGKTTLIAAKVALLIDKYNLPPEKIMILAFNKKAAKEIRDRIREKGKRNFDLSQFLNARTFHSLAFGILHPKEDILFDDRGDQLAEEFTGKLTEFVIKVVRENIEPCFWSSVYSLFRKEMEIVPRKFFTNPENYLTYRRGLREITLRGERVKSAGEKYIADFLFEHNIPYSYEKCFLPNNGIYRPDFYIYHQNREYVIEHWGIDENNPSSVPDHWTKNWPEYREEMNWKRNYWKNYKKNVVLIETSIVDKSKGREQFEAILKERLEEKGLICIKLPKEEIIEKLKEGEKNKKKSRIAEQFVQFISKAKNNKLSPETVEQMLKNYKARDTWTEDFLKLANHVYRKYEESLKADAKTDFYNILNGAAEMIHKTKGECKFNAGGKYVSMNDIEYLLIDEYQDFTKLFYEIINELRKYNERLKIFCVGDDWQAINGFAGADLQYFKHFKELLIPDSDIAYLLTNYRSKSEIIDYANNLMKSLGEPAKGIENNIGGKILVEYVDDVRIEMKKEDKYEEMRRTDEKFKFSADGKTVVESKYLKKCYEIIKKGSDSKDHKIAILCRTNQLYSISLKQFHKKLKSCFTKEELMAIGDFDSKISINTVHKFKGLEADVVIILNASIGKFPLIHPDNRLFEVLGQSIEDIIEEEKRLFYVAITRAKSDLWLITERGRESCFI